MDKNKLNNSYKNYIGRTFKVNDDDLPHKNKGSGKIVNVAPIEQNNKGELAVVRLTTGHGKNARPFKNNHHYYKGYKTFVETEFYNKEIITPFDNRLKENPWKYDLSNKNINEIRQNVYYNSRQSKSNREKVSEWKKRK